MYRDTCPSSTDTFYADKAYSLRTFAKPKRYTVNEISAYGVDGNHPDRAEVESFIAEVFYHAYQAKIKSFMPTLIALRDDNYQLMAAFGMREANSSALFLEQYLDDPIERVISNQLDQTVLRSDITEIGNLAVSNPRNSGVLIAHVIKHSIDAGVQWCVSTAHHTLQNGLIKGGVDVFPLQIADPTRLAPEEIANWGSYYKNLPQVVAIRNLTS